MDLHTYYAQTTAFKPYYMQKGLTPEEHTQASLDGCAAWEKQGPGVVTAPHFDGKGNIIAKWRDQQGTKKESPWRQDRQTTCATPDPSRGPVLSCRNPGGNLRCVDLHTYYAQSTGLRSEEHTQATLDGCVAWKDDTPDGPGPGFTQNNQIPWSHDRHGTCAEYAAEHPMLGWRAVDLVTRIRSTTDASWAPIDFAAAEKKCASTGKVMCSRAQVEANMSFNKQSICEAGWVAGGTKGYYMDYYYGTGKCGTKARHRFAFCVALSGLGLTRLAFAVLALRHFYGRAGTPFQRT